MRRHLLGLGSIAAGVFAGGDPAHAFPDLPPPPSIARLYGLEPLLPLRRAVFLDALTLAAKQQGLPPELADAVAFVESGYQADARGGAGEVGLMQILPGTAAMLGHSGSIENLARPEINIRYGVLYLSQAWRMTGGDLCRTLMKYRAGHGEERMSALSNQYCARARAHLTATGSPLASTRMEGTPWVKPQTVEMRFGPPATRSRGRKVRTAEDSRRFWAAHEARIKAVTARLALRDGKSAQN